MNDILYLSRCRYRVAVATAAVLWSTTAAAQEPAPGDRGAVSASVGAIVSYQPQGYDGTGGPYLDNSLGGVVPGLAVAIEKPVATRWLVALELSSTASLEATQSGRFVAGGGPALATHRDTLVSLLPGAHFPVGNGGVELKGGMSIVLGTPRQDDFAYDDSGWFGLTLGIDGVVRLGRQLDLVPSFRYSHVWRGPDALYVGLGDDIFRAGVGIRIRMGTQ
jgi:hypothetical protein